MRQFMPAQDGRREHMLRHWDRYQEAAVFDEWIANPDRHDSNILFDGDYWLIDHGHALTGPSWPMWRLGNPAERVKNDLMDDAGLIMSKHERYQWRKLSNALALSYDATPFDQLLACAHATQLITDDMASAVLSFLQQRVAHLTELTCQRLGIPELQMVGN